MSQAALTRADDRPDCHAAVKRLDQTNGGSHDCLREDMAMSSKSKTLNDLFLHTLKDMLYAEKHIGKALAKMAKAAQADDLKEALDSHRDETQGQIDRLDQVFKLLDKKAQAVPCEAIQGIIEETKEVMDDFEDSEALDAGLIAAAQAMEHYEIARYGALKTWASQLGENQAATLLEETLAEEKRADERLTALADRINQPRPETGGTHDDHADSHQQAAAESGEIAQT